tara:strand:- start:259 stop:477 length:219 start_codon:yes stop_codon:yes gene_type:complete
MRIMPKTENNQFSLLYSEIVLSKEEIIAAIQNKSPINELKVVMPAVKYAKKRRTSVKLKLRIFIEFRGTTPI